MRKDGAAMRGLKIAAIASVSLLLVMVLLVGYLFLTAEVRVTDGL